MNKLSLPLLLALIALPGKAGHAQFGVDILKIQRQISSEREALRRALDDSAKAKQNQAERQELATKKREAALKQGRKDAEKERERQQRTIGQLRDLTELRKAAAAQLEALTKLRIELERLRLDLQKSQEDLNAKQNIFDLERKVFENEKRVLESEKKLLGAEKESADDAVWKWLLGFVVTCVTAAIGGCAGVFQIVILKAEIAKLRREQEQEA